MKKMVAALSRSLTVMMLSGVFFIASGVQVALAACPAAFDFTGADGVKKNCVLVSSFNENCLYKCTVVALRPSTPG